MVFLYTGNTNRSWQIRNELDIATNLRIPILPVRFEAADVARSVRYFTNSHQWIDGISGAKKLKDAEIVAAVRTSLSSDEPELLEKLPTPRPGSVIPGKTLIPGVGLGILILAGLLLISRGSPDTYPSERLFNLAAGGTDSWNYATDIASAGDMGFFVAGTWDWGFWSEAWVARFDSSLALSWSWSDSLPGECGPRILPTGDGGVIYGVGEYADSCFSAYRVRAVRLDSLGRVVWDSRKRVDWPGSIQPVFGNMAWNADSTISMAFTLRSFEERESWATHLVRLEPSDGTMEWSVIPERRKCLSYLPLGNGGALHIYLDPLTYANGLELLSPNGETLHTMIVGDIRSRVTCATLTEDGGFLLALNSDSYGPENGNLLLVRFSEDYVLLWERLFGGEMPDFASRIVSLPDGNFLVVGSSRSFGDGSLDGWLILIDGDGELLWQTTLALGGQDRLLSADVDADGSFLVSGSTTAIRGEPDAWIARVSPDGIADDSLRLGLDVFREDWSNGFIDQAIWLMGRDRNYAATLRHDSLTGSFAVDLKQVPLLLRRGFGMAPGFGASIQVSVPEMPSVTGGNWIALGLTEKEPHEFLADQASAPLHHLRWNYTSGGHGHPREIRAVSTGGGGAAERIDSDRNWLSPGSPQRLAIEYCGSAISYILNDSLFFQAPVEAPTLDSVRVYIWGSSISLPHSVNSVRVYRRRW